MIVPLYRIVQGVVRFILFFAFRATVINEKEMPQDEPIVLCANHQSMLDPVFIGIYTKRPIHFMAKAELFKFKPFGAFLKKCGVFPVHREGSDIRALKTALQVLKENEVLGVFPEGTRVDTIDIKNFKDGVSVIAHRSKADIIPVRVHSTYKPFSRVTIEFRERINTEKLTAGLSKEEATQAITNAIFQSIYREELLDGNHHSG